MLFVEHEHSLATVHSQPELSRHCVITAGMAEPVSVPLRSAATVRRRLIATDAAIEAHVGDATYCSKRPRRVPFRHRTVRRRK